MTNLAKDIKTFLQLVYIELTKATEGRQSAIVNRNSAIVQSALLHSLLLISILIVVSYFTNSIGSLFNLLNLPVICVVAMAAFYVIVSFCAKDLDRGEMTVDTRWTRFAKAYPYLVMGTFVVALVLVALAGKPGLTLTMR